ncbi:MAG: class I SAM-dependent rRNA methyltransferase [Candidatus Sericytochromatia bacterium]|nr:class I SAM-dependent rRNA methyltransferase [Candidatus Sericytochromatia bacterium]
MDTSAPHPVAPIQTPLNTISGKVTIKKGRETRVSNGHPWVFSGEVVAVPPAETDGQLAVVEDFRGRFLGIGFINTRSNILVRLLSRQRESIDASFFARRVREAISVRHKYARLSGDSQAGYRVIHAEADGLPGLIVDRYHNWLVVQALSMGMAARLPELLDILREELSPQGIYERSDAPVRTLEGLPRTSGVLWGPPPPAKIVINEHGALFEVDIVNGQKTGFFLDQRLNRVRLRELVVGHPHVLNTFCYSGGFSIAAALGGAESVLSVDISPEAIELAQRNAELNGVASRCEWLAANAFDTLRELEKAEKRFDLVILDPPAFTKNKESIPGAIRGYKEINLRAMRLLNSGGLLVTSSCSHHITPAMFTEIVASAAADTRKRVRQIELLGPSPDHPVLPSAPETDYLKFMVVEVS